MAESNLSRPQVVSCGLYNANTRLSKTRTVNGFVTVTGFRRSCVKLVPVCSWPSLSTKALIRSNAPPLPAPPSVHGATIARRFGGPLHPPSRAGGRRRSGTARGEEQRADRPGIVRSWEKVGRTQLFVHISQRQNHGQTRLEVVLGTRSAMWTESVGRTNEWEEKVRTAQELRMTSAVFCRKDDGPKDSRTLIYRDHYGSGFSNVGLLTEHLRGLDAPDLHAGPSSASFSTNRTTRILPTSLLPSPALHRLQVSQCQIWFTAPGSETSSWHSDRYRPRRVSVSSVEVPRANDERRTTEESERERHRQGSHLPTSAGTEQGKKTENRARSLTESLSGRSLSESVGVWVPTNTDDDGIHMRSLLSRRASPAS